MSRDPAPTGFWRHDLPAIVACLCIWFLWLWAIGGLPK